MSDENRTRIAGVPLTPEEYMEFLDACIAEGVSPRDKLRELVLSWIARVRADNE